MSKKSIVTSDSTEIVLLDQGALYLSVGVKETLNSLITALLQGTQQGNIRQKWKNIVRDATQSELDILVRIPACQNLLFFEKAFEADKTNILTKRYILSNYFLIKRAGDSQLRGDYNWIMRVVSELIDIADMKAVLENSDIGIRGFLFYNSNLPLEILEIFSSDENSYIREGVARHKNSSHVIVRTLMTDPVERVRVQAAYSYKGSTGEIESIFLSGHPELHTRNVQCAILKRGDYSQKYYKHVISSINNNSDVSDDFALLIAISPYSTVSLRRKFQIRITNIVSGNGFNDENNIPF